MAEDKAPEEVMEVKGEEKAPRSDRRGYGQCCLGQGVVGARTKALVTVCACVLGEGGDDCKVLELAPGAVKALGFVYLSPEFVPLIYEGCCGPAKQPSFNSISVDQRWWYRDRG